MMLSHATELSLAPPAAFPSEPGFDPARMTRMMRNAVARIGLDLSGLTVLTEAATGAYGVTAVIAALAGAEHVYAFAKATRYGSVADIRSWTHALSAEADVTDRITIIGKLTDEVAGSIDIVTNSGHLRPISAGLLASFPRHAVLALMYEAWEWRGVDLDLEACRRRNILVAAVNERHPTIDVFSFLGPLCVKALHDAGFAVMTNRIAVLCDNDFGPSLTAGLLGQGAEVQLFDRLGALTGGAWDVVVVALTPHKSSGIDRHAAFILAERAPHALVLQVWGDVDRAMLRAVGLDVWPALPPEPGHMGVLLSELGPEPIVRLQTGGLRAAEIVRRGQAEGSEIAVLL